MSFLLPFLPLIASGLQAGAGLYGGYKANKMQKRQEKRGSNIERIPAHNPEQQRIFDMINSVLTGQGEQPQGGLFGEVYGDEGFKKAYADPALRMFNEEIAPGIAERFSGGLGIPGAASAQGSSGFQNALSQAGSQLAQSLGEFRQRQRMESLSGLTKQFLEPREHIQATPRSSPIAEGLANFGSGGFENMFKALMDLYGSKSGSSATVGA